MDGFVLVASSEGPFPQSEDFPVGAEMPEEFNGDDPEGRLWSEPEP